MFNAISVIFQPYHGECLVQMQKKKIDVCIFDLCWLFSFFIHKTWLHSHKIFEYELHTLTSQSSNQNAVFIVYDVLIGCFSSTSTKLIYPMNQNRPMRMLYLLYIIFLLYGLFFSTGIKIIYSYFKIIQSEWCIYWIWCSDWMFFE